MNTELKCVLSLSVCFMILFASRSTMENMEVSRRKLSISNKFTLHARLKLCKELFRTRYTEVMSKMLTYVN